LIANRCAALLGWAGYTAHRWLITWPPMLALLRISLIDGRHPAV
jgi:hypothetical protein